MKPSRENGMHISYFQNGGWFHGLVDKGRLFDSYTGFMMVWKPEYGTLKFVNPARVDEFSLYEMGEGERKVWESICDGKEG